MPVKRLEADSAVAIPQSYVFTMFKPRAIEPPTGKILHNYPPAEWKSKDGLYYHYWVNGKRTGIWIMRIKWIPIICFPHRITLRKPVWRVLSTTESPYILDSPTIKEAMRIGESYYKVWQEVNSK